MTAAEGRRKNGWSCPLHPYQLVSWIFIIILVTLAFLSSLPLPAFPLFPCYFMASYLGLIICIVVMTSIDPGYGDSKIQPQRFDSTVFRHVIENNYCHICQIEVPIKAKHCKYCNKCVAGFDHHCKWLNNCVGSKNYKMFFALISCITIISASILIINGIFLYLLVAGSLTKDINTQNRYLSVFNWKLIHNWAWLIVTVFSATFHLILFAVTAHLYRFHIMLWKNDLTTYSYIVNLRRSPHPNSRETLTGDGNARIPHGRAVYDSSIVNNAVTAPYNTSNTPFRPITPPRRLPEVRPFTSGDRPRKAPALPFAHIPRTHTTQNLSKPLSASERTANPV